MSKASRAWKLKWKQATDDRIYIKVNGYAIKVRATSAIRRKQYSKKTYMAFKRQCQRELKSGIIG